MHYGISRWTICAQTIRQVSADQGIFVLQDKAFCPFGTASDLGMYGSLQGAFAAGALRGALEALGVQSSTSSDVSAPPLCTLHVRVLPAQ